MEAQRLAILIAERRSISWGSMFESLRRKQKPSGQNIFPNQRVIFCVFFIVFSSSRFQCNDQLLTPKLCASSFLRPDLDSSTLGGDTRSRNLSQIIFSSVTKPLQSHCGQAGNCGRRSAAQAGGSGLEAMFVNVAA